MVFSALYVPMTEQATIEYVIPPLSNSYTATEEQCFLRELVTKDSCGTVAVSSCY
jgi:hypothetical protein